MFTSLILALSLEAAYLPNYIYEAGGETHASQAYQMSYTVDLSYMDMLFLRTSCNNSILVKSTSGVGNLFSYPAMVESITLDLGVRHSGVSAGIEYSPDQSSVTKIYLGYMTTFK